MPSIFSRIICGEIPCYKIAEDEYFFAFLDIEPLQPGHVLIVPKVEVDKFYDIGDEYLSKWLLFAQPIARAIEKAFDCARVGMSFIGLEVSHAHMHLVPINKIADMNFINKPSKPSQEALSHAQLLILGNLK